MIIEEVVVVSFVKKNLRSANVGKTESAIGRLEAESQQRKIFFLSAVNAATITCLFLFKIARLAELDT